MIDELETLMTRSLPGPWRVLEQDGSYLIMAGTKRIAVFSSRHEADLLIFLYDKAFRDIAYQHRELSVANETIQDLRDEIKYLNSYGVET
jgi:hypothetical protein